MKEYKKYIFDLDNTLLIPDCSSEIEYFKRNIKKDDLDRFLSSYGPIMYKLEHSLKRWDYSELVSIFKSYGFNLDEDFFKGWMKYNGEHVIDILPDGVIDTFRLLKEHNKDIIILTSWFRLTQEQRLKKHDLYPFIDELITGDDYMKPHIEAFKLAIKDSKKDECIMIGDNPNIDGFGAKNAGIDCYLIDKEHTMIDFYNLVLESLERKR